MSHSSWLQTPPNMWGKAVRLQAIWRTHTYQDAGGQDSIECGMDNTPTFHYDEGLGVRYGCTSLVITQRYKPVHWMHSHWILWKTWRILLPQMFIWPYSCFTQHVLYWVTGPQELPLHPGLTIDGIDADTDDWPCRHDRRLTTHLAPPLKSLVLSSWDYTVQICAHSQNI